ncbi:nucleotide exchange factor GrpE [Brachybacterium endophyticum]|uniref:Protein GrpE n=1 Tax=Brachybacterium endophyticum TaxID=2182385 RepID=A0A2U2RM64_9MICO|nr:nucleotide exchange factor GrpE [Brachybacterium endophyticum]PWH06874.1 nucleotide exchange factor GrpE [Brachybacterium endophyticum]
MTENQQTPDPEGQDGRDGDQAEAGFSFTDRRRVDPEDGSVRPSDQAGASEAAGEGTDPLDAEAAALYEQSQQDGDASGAPSEDASGESSRIAELEQQVNDLGEELKRSQAEYVNSRRRIENTAQVEKQAATERVLASLIGVLDDIELGRQHGDIAEGTPFHSIAAKLEDVLRGQGLERYGEVGDVFDPSLHEALMHEDSDAVEVNTVKLVMQPGYKVGERVLRPARVGTEGPQ